MTGYDRFNLKFSRNILFAGNSFNYIFSDTTSAPERDLTRCVQSSIVTHSLDMRERKCSESDDQQFLEN